MKGINFRSIKNRLILSFSAMAALLLIVVGITLFQVGELIILGVDVLETKQPSRLYLKEISSGIRHSNSKLQTYLLTGDEVYKEEISEIWENEIYAVIDSIDTLMVNWVNPENVIEYEKLVRLAERIKNKQLSIVDAASFGSNTVSIDLYNYSELSGDTIIGVDNLQMWINSRISENSSAGNDNGSLFTEELVALSKEADILVNSLYANFYEESLQSRDLIYKERSQFLIVETVIVIGSIFLFFLLFKYVIGKILLSVDILKGEVNTLSVGNIPDGRKETGDELDIVLEEIDTLSKNLADVKLFALEVGKGSFDNDITVFNNEGEIGSSLAEMRESLKQVSEEARIRNWSNKGTAELGDILRKNSSDLSELSDQVVSFLVKYLEANQGSLFIIEENNEGKKELQLKATYAYDRKKFIEKTIGVGQGLAGQVFLERQSIYLKEIPDDYVTITSGLGKATPNSIFIVPLIVNEEVYGVLEIGSFKEFDEHMRKFIEDIGENIASSIQAVKVNERTTNLLEESQQMTEEMRAQEEEMRQNMEELQATQEEMERNQRENKQRLEAIENSKMCFIEFDPEGYILNADQSFLELFGYNDIDEIKGKHHRIFAKSGYAETKEYTEFWNRLGQGENISGDFERITKKGKSIYIKGAYSCIKGSDGKVTRVMKFAQDITAQMLEIERLKEEKEELLKTIESIKSELNQKPESTDNKDLIALREELLSKLQENEKSLKEILKKERKDLDI